MLNSLMILIFDICSLLFLLFFQYLSFFILFSHFFHCFFAYLLPDAMLPYHPLLPFAKHPLTNFLLASLHYTTLQMMIIIITVPSPLGLYQGIVHGRS